MAQQSASQAKAALREALEKGAVRLSPEEISSKNVAPAPAQLRPRDITIADRDPDDPPIVISV